MGAEIGRLYEQMLPLVVAFFATETGKLTLFAGVTFAVVLLLRRNSFVSRTWKAFENAAFGNWRLALLGATGVVLSAASGWTTWDGMRNFTGEPILSAMVTFGIQGVMLIVAWLIGESFATGMNRRSRSYARAPLAAWAGAVLGVAAALAILIWTLNNFGGLRWAPSGALERADWGRISDIAILFAGGMIFIAFIAMNSRSDIALPYVQSVRIIARNMVLWVMFLACMATSVFFSFDSLFTAIFPPSERVRAADLRAQNQIAGIIADIDETSRRRRLTAIEELFANEVWISYDRELGKLAAAAQSATPEIERYFNDRIEARNRAIKEQQERVATSQSTQAGLATRKTTLIEELSRLKNERGTLAADFTDKKTELDARTRAVDAKRVEAMAEEQGAEGTLKQGRGPQYRQIMADLTQLQAALKIQEDRVKDAQKRLTTTDSRITQIERELATLDGDLAKLKGEAQTAEQRIKLTEEQTGEDPAGRVDPARVLPAFEAARAEFRQEPDAARLMKLQQQCTQVVNAMLSTEVTKPRVRGIECDPKRAGEAAGVVFALNEGRTVFTAHCVGGDKLVANQGADALFAFARKCLADSGLPSRETDQLRTKINFIELNRDDKAHRFVVTWNAFQDGNRLAYLALAIAIAIDSLVFMSGLFGANAVRSPLSDVPSEKARSATQLDAIIDTALIPHKFETARLVLGAMRPMTLNDGFMARIELSDDDPQANDILRVLNAGATIGAVRHADHDDTVYEVRAELFEYLSGVAKREFEANRDRVDLAELERTVKVALAPDPAHGASIVLGYFHPIDEVNGFMAEVRMPEVTGDDERTVRTALNAASTYQRVQKVEDENSDYFLWMRRTTRTPKEGHYWIHADFYKTLVHLRAGIALAPVRPQIAGPRRGHILKGGQLNAPQALPGTEDRKRLSDETAKPKSVAGPQPAPAEHRQPSVPSAKSDAPSKPIDQWERRCADVLFGSLGLDRPTAAARLDQDAVRRAALEAWRQLTQLAESSDSLQRYLDDHKRLQEIALGDAYSQLRDEADGDQRLIDVLDELDNTIQADLPVIMLFPENELIPHVIAQIERAAASDDGLMPGEQLLKNYLVDIRDRLAASDLARADTWEGVTAAIRELADKRDNMLRRFSPRRGV